MQRLSPFVRHLPTALFLIVLMVILPSAFTSAFSATVDWSKLRDPFTSPYQELMLPAPLNNARQDNNPHWSTEKIKQWRLQGIIGNRQQGFLALIHSTTGQWKRLRIGNQLEHYQIVEINKDCVLLRSLANQSQSVQHTRVLTIVPIKTIKAKIQTQHRYHVKETE